MPLSESLSLSTAGVPLCHNLSCSAWGFPMQSYLYVQGTDGLHMRSRLNISDLLCICRPSAQHMCSRSDVYWPHWTYCACATQLICTHTVATALTELPDIQMARVLKSLPEKCWRWNEDIWVCCFVGWLGLFSFFLVYIIIFYSQMQEHIKVDTSPHHVLV